MDRKPAAGRLHVVSQCGAGEVEEEVFAAICALAQAHACCVVGGWAVDFWTGRRTRGHADVDVLMSRGKSDQVGSVWAGWGASRVRVRDSGKVDVIFRQQRVALFPAVAARPGEEQLSDRVILQERKWGELGGLKAPLIHRDHLLAILGSRIASAKNSGVPDWKAEHDFSVLAGSLHLPSSKFG